MTSKLAKKLGDVISSIGVITKDETNPFFKSKYANINTILPHIKEEMAKVGLTSMAIIQNNSIINVFICQDTGETFPDINKNSIGLDIKTTKAQDRGSEITYYRRYLLCSNLLIEQADDDGNKASKEKLTKPMLHPTGEKWIKVKTWIQEGNLTDNEILNKIRQQYHITTDMEKHLKELNKKTA